MVVSEKLKRVIRQRWVVLVCAMWVEWLAGMSYMFGSISPIIKSTMGYNQKQLALLATAKDLGDNIGYLAGKLAHSNSPISRLYLVGAIHNVIGYSLIWLTVTHRIPYLPLWAVSFLSSSLSLFYYNISSTYSLLPSFSTSITNTCFSFLFCFPVTKFIISSFNLKYFNSQIRINLH